MTTGGPLFAAIPGTLNAGNKFIWFDYGIEIAFIGDCYDYYRFGFDNSYPEYLVTVDGTGLLFVSSNCASFLYTVSYLWTSYTLILCSTPPPPVADYLGKLLFLSCLPAKRVKIDFWF